MKYSLLLISLFAIAITSCKQAVSTTDDVHFGEVINEEGAASFVQVMNQLQSEDEFETKVVGTIEKVCKKKGCWVTLKDTDGQSEESLFVKFEDYGFFLPLDCEDRKVVMDGKAFKETTPVDELRHYAEDEGQSAEEIAAIVDPKVEYKFLASGVKMLN